VYGFEQSGEHRFLVMELVEGEGLSERIARGALPPEAAIRIAVQIARGLEAAHAKGIVHRDLKPANIKFDADGQVKILDFGLAREIVAEPEPDSLEHSPTITAAMTQAGTILGTAAYMSPEQARGKPVDARSDIWAFGCILYEMLSGEQAFPGQTVPDVIAKILEREPDLDKLPAGITPNVRRLLRRCLSKDRRTRLHHIADARLELDEPDSPAPSIRPQERPSPPRMLLWAPWLVVLALAVALGVALTRQVPASARVTRFSIEAPPGTSMREFRLSPDGRALAFVATEKLGTTGLYIRRFDVAEPELLANTTGASFPFWSPDGRALGFFQGGKLRRFDLGTRTTQTLADATNGRGADWSRDGTILFTPEGLEVLYTVPAEGGPATPLTRLRPDESFPEEATHRFPHFLPDGRNFIYVTQDPEAALATARSYLASLDAPDQRRPIVTDLSEVYAPPGYLLFVREGTLLAQPFDEKRLELSGTPKALAANISVAYPKTGGTSFSVSDNGVLAYRSIDVPPTELAWYDRAGNRLETLSDSAGSHIAPSLSPDGNRLAYLGSSGGETGELWVEDLLRNTKSRLTMAQEGVRINAPHWVNDHALIYILAGELFRRRVDRNDPPDLVWTTSGREADDIPQVVMNGDYGDGSLIVLENWDSDTDWDLWTLRPGEAARPEFLVRRPGQQRNPSLSPDGAWIAYDSDESGLTEIHVQSVNDPAQNRVVSSGGGQRPRWSLDGRELFYISPDFDLVAVSFQPATGQTTGAPKPLFRAPSGAVDAYWNLDPTPDLVAIRDGRFLFNAAREGEAVQAVQIVLNWDAELD